MPYGVGAVRQPVHRKVARRVVGGLRRAEDFVALAAERLAITRGLALEPQLVHFVHVAIAVIRLHERALDALAIDVKDAAADLDGVVLERDDPLDVIALRLTRLLEHDDVAAFRRADLRDEQVSPIRNVGSIAVDGIWNACVTNCRASAAPPYAMPHTTSAAVVSFAGFLRATYTMISTSDASHTASASATA